MNTSSLYEMTLEQLVRSVIVLGPNVFLKILKGQSKKNLSVWDLHQKGKSNEEISQELSLSSEEVVASIVSIKATLIKAAQRVANR